ncbi:amylovoran biosynthesis protein AmsF [Izhakiella australiensis]|uniref:Amylovoran biosynthesis protein AmsF n=1 Tax=Izhakiella australiensis TaxID=1926881 RepID=A0A1S8YM52_9GAMM|nr:glycosyl hydrolase family 28-related protein [Izhakiella australiensis]OON39733.1 amylovoran biosynthesis protein AmsF [Izhakiella australiensis]
MIEVNSFAELRTTAPQAAGDMALLKRYYDKDSTFRGGGMFVGFPGTTSQADDGGTLAKSGNSFYWKRVINHTSEVNLLHFGAKGDGVTDDSDAFKRMLNWSVNYNSDAMDIGVRFPPGRFFISPIDLTAKEMPFFAIFGDDNPYGLRPGTTIVSDQSNLPVFKVNARRTSINGITWNGQAKADTTANTGAITPDMVSNQQPFFENITIEGEFVNITSFRVYNNGGTAVKLMDTLDTRFNQIYTQYTYARIFDIGWSNSPKGVWDHSTAIELTNANFQFGYSDAVLYMPRVTQGIIRNVWIEHTRFPGDLSNGQWIIDALSMEDCANPLNLDNSRIQMRQLNLQTGGGFSTESSPGRWLSGYEMGWRRDENYGTMMTGSMKAGWYSGYKITNTSGSDNWYRLGKFTFPQMNQQWMIEMVGKQSPDTPSGVAGSPLQTVGAGRTYLNMQRCTSAVWADISHQGYSPVVDVRYKRTWPDVAEVWVKLKAGCGDAIFNLTSTGPTRFEAGACCNFTPDLSLVTDTTTMGTIAPNARLALHNGLAGIGANESGIVTLATASATAPTTTTPTGYVTLNINGVNRKVPFY